MHLFWKAQRLNTDVEPDSDLVRTLGEQRDSLLEKLIEYAVGTQSNTVEGIKRAVSSLFIGMACGLRRFTDTNLVSLTFTRHFKT